MLAIEDLIAETRHWLAFHRARGALGHVEGLGCQVRLKALSDALKAVKGGR